MSTDARKAACCKLIMDTSFIIIVSIAIGIIAALLAAPVVIGMTLFMDNIIGAGAMTAIIVLPYSAIFVVWIIMECRDAYDKNLAKLSAESLSETSTINDHVDLEMTR